MLSLSPQEKVLGGRTRVSSALFTAVTPLVANGRLGRGRGGFSQSPLILFPDLKHGNIILIQRN